MPLPVFFLRRDRPHLWQSCQTSELYRPARDFRSPTYSLIFANLDPGIGYTLRVIGAVLAAAGGTYTFSANLSSVPLPPAIWLFLSAVMGLAAFARARRGAQTAK